MKFFWEIPCFNSYLKFFRNHGLSGTYLRKFTKSLPLEGKVSAIGWRMRWMRQRNSPPHPLLRGPPSTQGKGFETWNNFSLTSITMRLRRWGHVTPKQAEEIVMADGWRLDHIKGSHYHYVHPIKSGLVTIPFHKSPKDLSKKTVSSIMKQAGLK